MSTPLPLYQVRILPALHQIQDRLGYLEPAQLKRVSKESGIPLYRFHEVASFFPHFHLAPPAPVTLRVCRDMACAMAGGRRMIQELSATASQDGFRVEGVSCLGRCDRAPAACLAVHRPPPHASQERYFFTRDGEYLRGVARACAAGQEPPAGDHDADLPAGVGWTIDPYAPERSDYAAVRKAVALRRAAIDRAAQHLETTRSWNREAVERFRILARGRPVMGAAPEREVVDALRDFQTAEGWAAGPELGGWADAILAELDGDRADLRGLGGAGVPAAQKWRDVRDAVRDARRRRSDDDRAFVIVNADESEPGTFKDREILLRAPHLVVEGAVLAGLVTEAAQAFVYVRHEYPEQIAALRAEIDRAAALGLCGENASVLGRPFLVEVFVSPGGYICGEQGALIEAMSDRRGEPRNIPPKLETNGLDDRPTLVSNVETYAWTPYIWIKGGDAYARMGVNACRGRRMFSVSGDVVRPGPYEVPMGLTLRELICGDDYCRGMAGGRALKAIAPSGPSGGFIPAALSIQNGALPKDIAKSKAWQELAGRRGFDPAATTRLDVLDLELELNCFRALSPTQALGAGIVVYAEHRDMACEAAYALEFFRNESCGKCVPCRIGSQKLAALAANLVEGKIDAGRWTGELLPAADELGDVMALTSICGLGRAAPLPLRTLADYFPGDVARHLAGAQAQEEPK